MVAPSLDSIDQAVSAEYSSSCKTTVTKKASIDGGLDDVGPIDAVMLVITEGADVVAGDAVGAGPTRKVCLKYERSELRSAALPITTAMCRLTI